MAKYKIKPSHKKKMVHAKDFKALGEDLTDEQLEELMGRYILFHPPHTHPYIDVIKGKPKAKRKAIKTTPTPPQNEEDNQPASEDK